MSTAKIISNYTKDKVDFIKPCVEENPMDNPMQPAEQVFLNKSGTPVYWLGGLFGPLKGL